jgi:hypothetical protein
MRIIQSKHAQIKFQLFSFWTVWYTIEICGFAIGLSIKMWICDWRAGTPKSLEICDRGFADFEKDTMPCPPLLLAHFGANPFKKAKKKEKRIMP